MAHTLRWRNDMARISAFFGVTVYFVHLCGRGGRGALLLGTANVLTPIQIILMQISMYFLFFYRLTHRLHTTAAFLKHLKILLAILLLF